MKKLRLLFLCIALFHTSVCLASENLSLDEFIAQTAQKNKIPRNKLKTLLMPLKPNQAVIDAMEKPRESLSWSQYRPIFLTEKRIQEGKAFIQEHEKVLSQIESSFGVPKEIITAILGVETYYGKIQGKFSVLDSLYTLAFHYPRRANFFQKELQEYLAFTHEENLDPRMLKGSYAGAMGVPQFISSSYRRYAIDFANAGQKDLFHNMTNAMASVANYLKKHGWEKSSVIAIRLQAKQLNPETRETLDLASLNNPKPSLSFETLNKKGIFHAHHISDPLRLGALIQLDEEFWFTYSNFYAITRYNHSSLYAMAVTQLAKAYGN